MIYAITFTTKHNSKINISDKSKIMINSSEVQLEIKRSHVEVENKNLFNFSYKII
jgi:hypothetical protein